MVASAEPAVLKKKVVSQVRVESMTKAESVEQALSDLASADPESRVLICGSLYLAGAVLRENG